MQKYLLPFALNLCIIASVFAQAKPTAPATGAAAPTVPTACIAEFKKVSGESDKIFAEGISKKIISAEDGAAYKKRDAAMQKSFDTLVADKKLTAAECATFVKTATTEKAAVTKMATPK
jgi:hypothetical protein